LSVAGRALRLSLLLLLLAPAGAAAQEGSPLSLRAGGAAERWRPLVRVEGVLRDAGLRRALDSGLPLRLLLRVELWERRLFDRLVDAQEIAVAVLQDPLEGDYLVEYRGVALRARSAAAADSAVGRALRAEIRPSVGGRRYYYLASLRVETLSLSDLDELRRWLRGEVAPAIGGRSSPEAAVGSGMSRLLVRVLGLPERSYDARSETFTPR
jgi:hypothetical protein